MNAVKVMIKNHDAFMREKKEIRRLREMDIVSKKETEVSMTGRGKWDNDAIKTLCSKAIESIKAGQVWEISVPDFLKEFYSGTGVKYQGYSVKMRVSNALTEMSKKHHAVQKANKLVYVKLG